MELFRLPDGPSVDLTVLTEHLEELASICDDSTGFLTKAFAVPDSQTSRQRKVNSKQQNPTTVTQDSAQVCNENWTVLIANLFVFSCKNNLFKMQELLVFGNFIEQPFKVSHKNLDFVG